MRNRYALVALLSAVLMAAGGLVGCDQESSSTNGDPRVEGVMPHPLPAPDISILAAQGGAKRGTTSVTPPRPAPATATSTDSAPSPESGTASVPGAGSEASNGVYPVVPDDGTTAYTVKFSRPVAVGSNINMRIIVDSAQTVKTTPPGGATKEETKVSKGDLSGRISVASIDPVDGSPKDFTFTVTKFTGADGKDLVPAGKILDVRRGDKQVMFSLAGETLSDAATDVLKSMFDPARGQSSNDDDVYGSPSPHKVGETWPINKDNIAKQVNSAGTLVVEAKNIGDDTVILRGVVNTPVGKALKIEAAVNIKALTPGDLPAGATVDSGSLKMQMGAILPVDTNQQPVESFETGERSLHLTTPKLVIEINEKMNRKTLITPEGAALPAPAAIEPPIPAGNPTVAAKGDFSTPKKAVKSLFAVMAFGNRDEIKACFAAPANDAEKVLLETGWPTDLVRVAVYNAAKEKFPDQLDKLIPDVSKASEDMIRKVDSCKEEITGDKATVTSTEPPRMIGTIKVGGPLNDPIKLMKVGSDWKLTVAESSILHKTTANQQQVNKAMDAFYVTIVADIKAGKFAKYEDVEKAMDAKQEELEKKYPPGPTAG